MNKNLIIFFIGVVCMSVAVGLLKESFAAGLLCFGIMTIVYTISVAIFKTLEKCF